jgi:streptogramin lyase
MLSNMVGLFRLREGANGPNSARRAVLGVLLGLAAFLTGCEDRERTSTVVTAGGDPNARARLEITSDPTDQVWIANVGDDNTLVTINGKTPFSQDFPAPDGLGVGIRKVSAGGILSACLTNLSTGERRCGDTTAPQGVVSLAISN